MWLTSSRQPCLSNNNSDQSDLSDLENIDDDIIDPRVQEELERLNNATDAINKLEVELDEARANFRQLLSESSQRINGTAKKLGSCIEKARPYYEARMKAKEAQMETQKAALRFERANSAHSVAKEMVFLAEEGLKKEGRTFDPAWQEMLNHATMRVNEAERERTLSEQEHQRTSKSYNDADRLVKDLKKELKKNITKSSLSARRNLLQLNDLAHQHQLLLLPYFEMKAQFNKMLEEQKRKVQELEESVLKSKLNYADALHNLEEISDEIHQKRRLKEKRRELGVRGTGVGAEHPEPNIKCEDAVDDSNTKVATTKDEEYMELPSVLRLPKSLSSSTLSHMLMAQQAGENGSENATRYASRLRKSKSVMDRTAASPLFGRYSISRTNKLQVDHASQTEDDLAKLSSLFIPVTKSPDSLMMPPLSSGCPSSKSVTPSSLIVDDGYDGATSSDKSSLVGSEATSPASSASRREPAFFSLSLPLTIGSGGGGDDVADYSDTESVASIDGLNDEQIESLMIDKDLEDAAQNLKAKTELFKHSDARFKSQNCTTQTSFRESPEIVIAIKHNSSETVKSQPENLSTPDVTTASLH